MEYKGYIITKIVTVYKDGEAITKALTIRAAKRQVDFITK